MYNDKTNDKSKDRDQPAKDEKDTGRGDAAKCDKSEQVTGETPARQADARDRFERKS